MYDDPEVLASIIAALLDRDTNALAHDDGWDPLYQEAIEAVGGREEVLLLARNWNLRKELEYAIGRVVRAPEVITGSRGVALRANVLNEVWEVLTYCGIVLDSPNQNDTPNR